MAIVELEQLKQKLASLEVSLTEYTRNISLPIKETIQKEWDEVKTLLTKFEEKTEPVVPLKTKK